jgi:uncharacterized metal-binding protein
MDPNRMSDTTVRVIDLMTTLSKLQIRKNQENDRHDSEIAEIDRQLKLVLDNLEEVFRDGLQSPLNVMLNSKK